MMHSFEGLANEISTLLKTRGDTGDRGDKLKNINQNNRISVTPRGMCLSPLEIEGCHRVQLRGDGKSDSNQSLARGVTRVTPVTRYFQQGRTDDFEGKSSTPSHAFSAEQNGSCPSLAERR